MKKRPESKETVSADKIYTGNIFVLADTVDVMSSEPE